MTKEQREKAQKAVTAMKHYWESVMKESSREDVLYLAEKMGLRTHHESGRQINTKTLKGIIAYNKENQESKAIYEFHSTH